MNLDTLPFTNLLYEPNLAGTEATFSCAYARSEEVPLMPHNLVEECRLEGGPAHLPDHLRTATVPRDGSKVKVPFHNGWEHFERIHEFTQTGEPIFRWTMRTKIAE